MKTPELPPIEYKPTFRLDSSGLVVTRATQDEWDSAVKAFKGAQACSDLSGHTSQTVVEIP